MNTLLKIKLLHERLGHAKHRKIDGRSGKKYLFHWCDAARAYCFTPANQAESDDIFNSQGSGTGAYFAPLVPDEKEAAVKETGEVPPELLLELVRCGIVLPADNSDVAIANALLAAHISGAAKAERMHAHAAKPEPVPAVAPVAETVAPFPVQPARKCKSPPPVPTPK